MIMNKLILLLFLCNMFCGQSKAQWTEIDDLPYVATSISFDDQGNRFVTLQQGYVLKNQDTILTLPVWFFNEKGLITAIPNEHYLYIHLSGLDSNQYVIRYDTISTLIDTLVCVPYTNPHSTQHVGGGLAIADTLLFSAFGYGGNSNSAQDSSDWRGKIIVTNLNTFESEIHAIGLRNPFRIHWDSLYQRLYIADVGSDIAEEVNISLMGENFGWPMQEGDTCFTTCDSVTYPVYWYSQSQPRYIIGGVIFNYQYFYSDGGSGKGGRLDSLHNNTPVSCPKDFTCMAINPSDNRLYAINWIGKVWMYDELPLGIIEIISRPYKKKDWHEYWLAELIEIYGDPYFTLDGKILSGRPNYPGMYYSFINQTWVIIQ